MQLSPEKLAIEAALQAQAAQIRAEEAARAAKESRKYDLIVPILVGLITWFIGEL